LPPALCPRRRRCRYRNQTAASRSDRATDVDPDARGGCSIPDLPDSAVRRPGNVDIAKLDKELARAEKRAASAERLFKAGIIAKMEAEQRALKSCN
jgi:hypothetical protein